VGEPEHVEPGKKSMPLFEMIWTVSLASKFMLIGEDEVMSHFFSANEIK
jgi:hypothetical protein